MPQHAEPNRRQEENRGENRGRPCQEISRATTGYQAASTASHAERATLRPLEKDEHDHRDRSRDVNDKKDGAHKLSTGRNWGEVTIIHDRFRRQVKPSKPGYQLA
jgi:hypothetical protein